MFALYDEGNLDGHRPGLLKKFNKQVKWNLDFPICLLIFSVPPPFNVVVCVYVCEA